MALLVVALLVDVEGMVSDVEEMVVDEASLVLDVVEMVGAVVEMMEDVLEMVVETVADTREAVEVDMGERVSLCDEHRRRSVGKSADMR